MPETIGPKTPLELTPEGFVRPLYRGRIIPHSEIFTVQELQIGRRVIARGGWRSCTLIMKGMEIEETRIIGQDGYAEFSVESRSCGRTNEFLAEHGLILRETSVQSA